MVIQIYYGRQTTNLSQAILRVPVALFLHSLPLSGRSAVSLSPCSNLVIQDGRDNDFLGHKLCDIGTQPTMHPSFPTIYSFGFLTLVILRG